MTSINGMNNRDYSDRTKLKDRGSKVINGFKSALKIALVGGCLGGFVYSYVTYGNDNKVIRLNSSLIEIEDSGNSN